MSDKWFLELTEESAMDNVYRQYSFGDKGKANRWNDLWRSRYGVDLLEKRAGLPEVGHSSSEVFARKKPVISETQALMVFQANKKSVAISYLLWFILGAVGAHRFYNGKIGSGIFQLIVNVICAATALAIFPLMIMGLWLIVDLFLIPGWVREKNNRLLESLGVPIHSVVL